MAGEMAQREMPPQTGADEVERSADHDGQGALGRLGQGELSHRPFASAVRPDRRAGRVFVDGQEFRRDRPELGGRADRDHANGSARGPGPTAQCVAETHKAGHVHPVEFLGRRVAGAARSRPHKIAEGHLRNRAIR